MTALHPPTGPGEHPAGDSGDSGDSGDPGGYVNPLRPEPHPGEPPAGEAAPQPWEPGFGFEAEIGRARRYERGLAFKALIALAVVAVLVLARVYLFG
jgi:hypothetical protein